MWNRLGHFVPSKQMWGKKKEQKPSFYLKTVKRLLLCTQSSSLGPHAVPCTGPHPGRIARKEGRP